MPEIKGKAIDSETGSPISDSRIDLIFKDGKTILRSATDLQGRFSFKDVPPGTYDLELHSLYHFPATVSVSVTTLAEVTLYSSKSILSASASAFFTSHKMS